LVNKKPTIKHQGKIMSKEVITFEYEKETKNSVRYQEVPAAGKAPIVGSLYVQKWFAGGAKSLQVTIELNQ
jgi:hypothetical protein